MILVGIGEMHVAGDKNRVLVARSLGAAAALSLFDPQTNTGGMLHWLLPDASLDPGRAERNPAYFASTGIPRLIDEMEKRGVRPETMRAFLAGAATLPEGGTFDVGSRNGRIALEILAKLGIRLESHSIGGTVVRDLRLEMNGGDFLVTSSDL